MENLLEAARKGQLDVMETLLRNGKEDVDCDYRRCLQELFGQTLWPDCGQVVKLLLDKVEPKVITPEPIHCAAELGNHLALEAILSHETCRVNAEREDGRTALHLVAKNFEKDPANYSKCLKMLLQWPTIDVNHPSLDNCTAIVDAALSGAREAVVKMLQLRASALDLETVRHLGFTPRDWILVKFPDLREVLPPVRVATGGPQALLLEAVLQGQVEVFTALLQQVDLEGSPVVNPDHFYGQPHCTTCIEEACSSGRDLRFLEALLRAKADPNLVNPASGLAPIHVAISCGNLPATKLLLQQASLILDVSDVRGSTPLHYVIKDVHDEQEAEGLVRQMVAKGADVDVEDKAGMTPVMRAVKLKKKLPLAAMLPETVTEELTLKSYVETHFPDFGDVHVGNQNGDRSTRKLFHKLYDGNCKDFLETLESSGVTAEDLDKDEGRNTFLQTACSLKDSERVVKALLRKGVEPNLTTKENSSPPLVIAAEKGNCDVMKVLLDDAGDKLDVNKGDTKGRTALHVAAKKRNLEMVVKLLNAGAKMDAKDNLGREPISTEAMKDLMDMSLQADKDTFPHNDDYRIKLDLGLFVPGQRQTASAQAPTSGPDAAERGSAINSANHESQPSNSTENESQPLNSSKDESITCNETESARLWYIIKNYPDESILKHPLVQSFVLLKWPRVRAFYWTNLVCVLLFTILLNLFFIIRCHNNDECSDNEFLIILIIVFAAALLVREIIQILTFKGKYVKKLENYVDLALIFFAPSSSVPWGDENARLILTVITVLLSWSQLFLVSGRHPFVSDNMKILKTVTKNFLIFLAWYSILLCSFATCFLLLLRANNETFSNIGLAVFNVFAMMVGDLNSSSVKFDVLPGLSYPLFAAFIFLVTIVMFNLLNGLAISDIQQIRESAALLSIGSRVRLIKDIEHSLTNIDKRRVRLISRIFCPDGINIFPAEPVIFVYPNKKSCEVVGAEGPELSMDESVVADIIKIIGVTLPKEKQDRRNPSTTRRLVRSICPQVN